MVLTTAINGDRAFALPVALRRRPEARLLPPPPARSIQAARNGSPALRLGKTPAVLRLEGRLVPLRLADATVPSLRADPTLNRTAQSQYRSTPKHALFHGHAPAPDRCAATASQRSPPARHLCPPFFFAPAERTQRPELSPGISSRLRRSRSTLPPRTHRALLHRRVPALFIFRLVYLPRISRSRAHRRGQAAQGPRRARLFFRLFDPALAMASRHDAPYLSDRPCMVGAALRRRYHPPKCLRAYVPHHGLYL